jgi:hypothetical protein
MAVITKNTGLRPSIKPSLNLDFTNNESVDRRIRFVRGTRATYTDSTGTIRIASSDQARIDHDGSTKACKGLLIEETKTNIAPAYELQAAAININTFTRPYQTRAPDGTMSAFLLQSVPTPPSVTCILFNALSSVSAGNKIVASIYIKAGPAPDTLIWRVMNSGTNVDYGTATINWSSGVPSTTGSGSTVTDVGNGWYRLTVVTTVASGQSSAVALLYVSAGSVGNKNVYFWGPQLEVNSGEFATSYIPVTPSFTSRGTSGTYFDSNGIMRYADVNVPRYNHVYDNTTGKWTSVGLMIEPERTNILPSYNAAFGWAFNGGGSVNSINQASPDGGFNAVLLNMVNGGGPLQEIASVKTLGLWTTSTYIKSTSTNQSVTFGFGWSPQGTADRIASYNLTTGVVSNISSGLIATMEPIGNGWWRLIATIDKTNNEYGVGSLLYGQGTETLYQFGWQLESGGVATSLIPTYGGAAATRSADVGGSVSTTRLRDIAALIGPEYFNSWWNDAAQTYYAEASQLPATAYGRLIDISDGQTQRYSMYRQDGTGKNGINSQLGIELDSWATNTFAKFACSFGTGGISSSFNGNIRTNAGTFTPFSADRMNIGAESGGNGVWNGHIKKISFFPKRLSSDELQNLTK